MKIARMILWITALVLIGALGFSVISISVKQSGGGSKQIATKQVKNSQKFSDGLPREGLFKYEPKISKAGKYRITFDPKLSSDTFVIGSEVYDSDGKLLGASILYNDETLKTEYQFTEGICCLVFRYITTEQDFRDFVEEYEASYNAKSITQALQKVDFDGFKENGTASVNCKVSLGAVSGYRVGYVDVSVMIGICTALIAVLIVLGAVYKQIKPAEPESYDGTAPEVPAPPAPKPAANPQPTGYAQPVYQYVDPGVWACPYCGENRNTGRFCAACGQPRPVQQMQPVMYQFPAYQTPVYQLPPYPVQYQVPATYQMPYQPVQYLQPVQHAYPAVPAPVQQVYMPVSTYQPAQMPDYSAKAQKPAPAPADPEFVSGIKERIPAVASRYAAFCVIFLVIQLAGAILLTLLVPDIVKQYRTSLSFGLVVLSVDVIGFPFIWLLMRSIPKTKIEQHKIGFQQWFGFLMMTEALMIAGSLIGNPIHTILTEPFTGDSLDKATSLMQNSNVILRTLVVGIGAPVFEELIFRKVLIDRTIKYGEYISIVLSGIMFGLLHGNFAQFFFAAGVGMLFAYVYIRTGRVRYTIYLHMAVNLSSALVLQTLLQKILDEQDKGSGYSKIAMICAMLMLTWLGGVLAIGIIGIVKLIKGLKRKSLALNMMKGEPAHKEVRSLLIKDKAVWLYIAMCILFFLHSYVPNMIIYFLGK